LGGNTRTIVVACVAPTALHAAETVSTLQFADRAKSVMLRVRANTVVDDKELLTRANGEIARLKTLLAHAMKGAGHGDGAGREQVERLVAENEALKGEVAQLRQELATLRRPPRGQQQQPQPQPQQQSAQLPPQTQSEPASRKSKKKQVQLRVTVPDEEDEDEEGSAYDDDFEAETPAAHSGGRRQTPHAGSRGAASASQAAMAAAAAAAAAAPPRRRASTPHASTVASSTSGSEYSSSGAGAGPPPFLPFAFGFGPGVSGGFEADGDARLRSSTGSLTSGLASLQTPLAGLHHITSIARGVSYHASPGQVLGKYKPPPDVRVRGYGGNSNGNGNGAGNGGASSGSAPLPPRKNKSGSRRRRNKQRADDGADVDGHDAEDVPAPVPVPVPLPARVSAPAPVIIAAVVTSVAQPAAPLMVQVPRERARSRAGGSRRSSRGAADDGEGSPLSPSVAESTSLSPIVADRRAPRDELKENTRPPRGDNVAVAAVGGGGAGGADKFRRNVLEAASVSAALSPPKPEPRTFTSAPAVEKRQEEHPSSSSSSSSSSAAAAADRVSFAAHPATDAAAPAPRAAAAPTVVPPKLSYSAADVGNVIQMFSFRFNAWGNVDILDYEPTRRMHQCRLGDGSVQWMDLKKKPIREVPLDGDRADER